MPDLWRPTITEPGPYWWRAAKGDRPAMRLVGAWPAGGLVVEDRRASTHSDGIAAVEDVGGEWYGPLEPPLEEPDA